MKRRAGERRKRIRGTQPGTFSCHAALCAGHLRSLWLLEPPPAARPPQVHPVVAVPVSARWRGNRLGHVPLLALKERAEVAREQNSINQEKKWGFDAMQRCFIRLDHRKMNIQLIANEED